jgi:hypothetical protein
MKKKILLLSIVLVSFTAFSFAAVAPVSVSKNVVISFNKQFNYARDIKWKIHADFVKSEFSINECLYAYYNQSGDLIAVTRYISPNQLPLVY